MDKPKINSYSFGEIVVDNITHKKDLIITKNEVQSNWRRKKGHCISLNDLEKVLINHPQILVVGTGLYGRVVIDKTVISFLNSAGIKLIQQKTDTACKTYNELSNDHDVIAALHLAC